MANRVVYFGGNQAGRLLARAINQVALRVHRVDVGTGVILSTAGTLSQYVDADIAG
jgi:hypothetical protein